MSDPECGRCKFCAREHEMKDKPGAPTTLPTSLDLYEFLKCKMIEPGDSLVKKKIAGSGGGTFGGCPRRERAR